MSFHYVETEFARIASARYGCNATIVLDSCNDLTDDCNCLYYMIDADVGPLSHYPDRPVISAFKRHDFMAFEPDLQVEMLISKCDRDLEKNREKYRTLAAIIAELPAEQACRLRDLRLRIMYSHPEGAEINCNWIGYGNDLQIVMQLLEVTAYRGDNLRDVVTKALERAAQRDIRLEVLAARGLRLDAPLRALLRDTGHTESDLIEAAKLHGYTRSREQYEKGLGAMSFAGHLIKLSFTDGNVTSEISINDAITWSKGCLTVRDLDLPAIMATSLRGNSLRSVVDHPWLDGLVVTSVNQSKAKSGRSCVTFMTKAA